MRLPIRARLTLTFAVLMAAALAVTGAFVYHAFAAQLDNTIEVRLTSLAKELVGDLEEGDSRVLDDFGEGDSEGFFAQVLNGDGSIAEVQDTLPEPLRGPRQLAESAAGSLFEQPVRGENGSEARPARLTIEPAPDGRFVVVGTSLEGRHAALQQLATVLWLTGPLLAAVASGFAWLLGGAALRPVENLRRQAALITEGDLARRLPVPDTGDEIATLAKTLNDMLARLEEAFERERRFVDDASHELRTPLGVLKTELDLALRRSRTKEELEAALRSASEESERLNRLAEDLLVLARADRGKLPLRRESVEAAVLLNNTAARFAARIREQGVRLEVSAPPGFEINVDVVRIEQAIGNLIANALAHTPKGGRICVAAHVDSARELVLAVSDNGAGFPTGFIKDAFAPFTRADASRSRREGGAGLGLAIVKSVAEAHGGSASAMNGRDGGAVVTLRIPQ
jgi:two-component system, OmpR family, sensor kinase